MQSMLSFLNSISRRSGLSKGRVGFELKFEWEIHIYRTRQSAGLSVGCLPCYINALPVELLARIFELCLTCGGLGPYSAHHVHLSKISCEEAPLNLLTVCRLWRTVAFGTHTLWDGVCPSQNSIIFMKKWLQIAPKIPFHFKIAITAETWWYDRRHKHALKMFQLFSTTAHRWKSLELQFDLNALYFGPDLTRLIQLAIRNLFVPLHFLVTIYRGGYSREIEDIFSALSSTTWIERFRWKHCTRFRREFRPNFQQLPGKGIKILEISHPATTAEFVGYLIQCEAATTVKFVQGDRKPGVVPVVVPSGLPHRHVCLTSLSLSSRTNPMAILKLFTFPSLRKLCIGMSNRDRYAFTDFLTTTPDLESLLVHENDLDDYSLRYYLTNSAMRRVPNVRVTFKHASKRGVRTVKQNLSLFNSLPTLACWRQPYDDDPERLQNDPDTKLVVFVGWGEGSVTSKRIWCFHDGALEFGTKTVLLE